jgi:hypothetical protein
MPKTAAKTPKQIAIIISKKFTSKKQRCADIASLTEGGGLPKGKTEGVCRFAIDYFTAKSFSK